MADGVLASVDWLRMVGDAEHHLEAMTEILERRFGAVKETRRGKFFCRSAWYFEGGASLHFQHVDGVVVLEVPGGACGLLGSSGVVELMTEVYALLGTRATRIDLAVDLHEWRGRELIDQVREAAASGCMVGARRWKAIDDRSGRKCVGEGVSCGSREGSKFVRFYDKGLEQLTCERGQWVRMEAEFKTGDDERANTVGLALVGLADDGTLAAEVAAMVVGSIDFRERAGKGDRHLSRRARLGWWESMVQLVGRRVVEGRRRLRTLVGFGTYMRRAAAQLVALAEATGRDLVEAVELVGVTAAAAVPVGSNLEGLIIAMRDVPTFKRVERT